VAPPAPPFGGVSRLLFEHDATSIAEKIVMASDRLNLAFIMVASLANDMPTPRDGAPCPITVEEPEMDARAADGKPERHSDF